MVAALDEYWNTIHSLDIADDVMLATLDVFGETRALMEMVEVITVISSADCWWVHILMAALWGMGSRWKSGKSLVSIQ